MEKPEDLGGRSRSPSWRERRDAARELGTFAEPWAVTELSVLLADANENVRAAAADALGATRDPRVVPLLRPTVFNEFEDFAVRHSALLALRELGAQGVGVLEAVVADLGLRAHLREEAVLALGDLGVPSPTLMAALSDDSRRVRHSARRALEKMGN